MTNAEDLRRKADVVTSGISLDLDGDPLRAARARCGRDNELLMVVLDRLGPRVASSPVDPLMHQEIGGYKIHWRLGSGGNGVVYLATRIEEPHQQVAMKFLRLQDTDDEQFRLRFERELKILALLRHNCIVKLYYAGPTKGERPYFVMEHVDGTALDRHCKDNRLTVTQRLNLFLKICDAVQYLHQNLIVHRDLKPANVMVDNDGNPKVLDFGIAKLLRPELMDGEPLTIIEQSPLTPNYASPEQWEKGRITVASDVYSLGAILFLLLAGRLPITFGGKTENECVEVVCRQVAPLASKSVVGGHGARCREINDAGLAYHLAGDLDAILAKALQKDVIDRYSTVSALSEDIQRHLQFLPVRARRGSVWYKTRRLIRRNRPWAVSAISVLLALGLGLSIALVQRNEARRERNEANQQRMEAERETERANKLTHQREDMLGKLQQQLDAKGTQDKEFRFAVANLTEDLKRSIRAEEGSGNARGGEGYMSPQLSQYLLRARNYEMLGRLLTLSGNQQDAHQAYQGCVTVLTKAQSAGYESEETKEVLRRCSAGL